MRILVTNDDGVRSPGIAALASTLSSSGHDIVVVAPMVDYSGASAAVGPVHSRDGVDYESHTLDGAPHIPAYGIDGPPALAVILSCVGAFGPCPDAIVSGINHGANVGRSAAHSGTVGAALTATHFGIPGLAVSIRFGKPPVPWLTPAKLAASLTGILKELPEGVVLNLNVPDVAMSDLKGAQRGTLGRSGTIRSAVHETSPDASHGAHHSERSGRRSGHFTLPPAPAGTLKLDLAPPWNDEVDLTTDAGLIRAGYASITPLIGVRDAMGSADVALKDALALLSDEIRIASAGL